MLFVWQMLAILALAAFIVFVARLAAVFIVRSLAPSTTDAPSGLPVFLVTLVLSIAGILATAIAADGLGIFR